MNDREIYSLGKKKFDNLRYKTKYDSGQYTVIELNSFKNAIQEISKIPFLKKYISSIQEHSIFQNSTDELIISSQDHFRLKGFSDFLLNGLEFFFENYESKHDIDNDNSIMLKLPPIKDFTDFEKISSKFKIALEIPLSESNIESNIEINSAEPGSIWLAIDLASKEAVKFFGSISWAAAVISKEKIDRNNFKTHAISRKLDKEMIDSFFEQFEEKENDLILSEAQHIIESHYVEYNENDPEKVSRMGTSIKTLSELFDKGAKLLPGSSKDDLNKSFPDYDSISLIESKIKKLPENGETK